LLTVPQFDHRWQMAYELETPLELPAGSKLVVTAHYDNSKMQMHNPAPEKPVYFRDMNQSWDEMFTPFVQYSIDTDSSPSSARVNGDAQSAVRIGEVTGCLEPNPVGNWYLTKASSPVPSQTQATNSAAIKAAQSTPLGSERYELLGLGVFNPASRQGKRVVAKGLLVPNSPEVRINVTSLQTIADTCSK
jgi:hypothetical protein